MIKLVLFDLDGVLIDAKDIHYKALNDALGPKYSISKEDHVNIYDGRKTRDKLWILTEKRGLPVDQHESIYQVKQKRTKELISKLEPINNVLRTVKVLSEQGYKIGVCSNSIRQTVFTALSVTGLIQYCNLILSNEDVLNPKPHPEIYWRAMAMSGVLPKETLIVEDSPIGLLAANSSGANYYRIDSPYDLFVEDLPLNTNSKPKLKWVDPNLNVLIPMAGSGSRFVRAGYTFPKPLIDVLGKPMIQLVVENLGIDANYIFVVQKSHNEKYNLTSMLNIIVPNCTIIEVDGVTEGAACTALLARDHIDNEKPLFFANSDQYAEWDSTNFMYSMQSSDVDGGIVTFKDTHPKWSFAKTDKHGIVTEVAEKNPISDNATVGFYYWKHGKDFVRYAEQMIRKNIRVNNEFYVCPVFNEAISAGKKIKTHLIDRLWGLGTPEDLENFLRSHA